VILTVESDPGWTAIPSAETIPGSLEKGRPGSLPGTMTVAWQSKEGCCWRIRPTLVLAPGGGVGRDQTVQNRLQVLVGSLRLSVGLWWKPEDRLADDPMSEQNSFQKGSLGSGMKRVALENRSTAVRMAVLPSDGGDL
jgi:hypothetical protein